MNVERKDGYVTMNKNRFATILAAATIGITPIVANSANIKVAQAATTKMVMHTAIAYDKNGNSLNKRYNSYQYVSVESNPVKIDGSLYYKVSGQDEYLKATNIDGVKRSVVHNAYIYSSSTRRTSLNNRWKLYKGETVTTYGGSYKFKNGKRYFRVGGPQKQYIRTANLGPVIGANTTASSNTNNSQSTTNTNNSQSTNNSQPMSKDETTVTVNDIKVPIFKFDKNSTKPIFVKNVPNKTTFTVDYAESGERANNVASYIGQFGGEQRIYHIKGTDNWIYSMSVKAASTLPVHNYDLENMSLIKFIKTTDLYNADGTLQNIRIEKNYEQWKVDKLVYIWVPSENIAEEFYHLTPSRYWKDVQRLSSTGQYVRDHIALKDPSYVKANDVKFVDGSVKLTPSNTPEQAKAAATSQTTTNNK